MADVTHDQANLLLRLYELRREPRLREAREWVTAHYYPASVEEAMKLCPPGSRENASLRMVLGYWEMAASMVNRDLIDEEFFFENSGEQWVVWERIKPVLAGMRAAFKNPHAFENLEKHCTEFEQWREKRAPGCTEPIRKMVAQFQQPTTKATNA